MQRFWKQVKALLAMFTLVFITGYSSSSFAFDVSMDVQPRLLPVGEATTLTISIHGLANAPQPGLPAIEGFQLLGTSSEQNISFGGGNRQSTRTFHYQLKATKEGQFAIGPFDYDVNGQKSTLPGINVKVVAQGQAASNPNQTPLGDVLFARLISEQTEVYNQEFFDLYVYIYSRGIRMAREIDLTGIPPGLGTSKPQELRQSREQVNGQVFDVRRFRIRTHALTAGSFTLDPDIQIHIAVPNQQRTRRSLFDDMFGMDSPFSNQKLQTVTLEPDPLPLTVRSLPEKNKPLSFNGAVGQFSFAIEVKPSEVTAGDPITMRSTIKGRGNMDAITAPELALGEHFKVYDAKLVEKDVRSDLGEGTKVFEQVVIAQSEKVTELPEIRFSFFEPKEKTYIEVKKGPFPLKVLPAPDGPALMLQAAGENLIIPSKTLGKDIEYLKPTPTTWHHASSTPWYTNSLFLGLQTFPLLALGVLGFIVRRRDLLQGDVARARRLQAPRSARTAMRQAQQALENQDLAAFYEALARALTDYFSNRLNLAPGDVVHERVQEAMEKTNLATHHQETIKHLFDTCERYRFGAGHHNQQAAQEDLSKMNDLFKVCEKL